MNIPKKIKTDVNYTNKDGTPKSDIGIHEEYLVVHPDMLEQSLDMFKTLTGLELEIID